MVVSMIFGMSGPACGMRAVVQERLCDLRRRYAIPSLEPTVDATLAVLEI